MHALVTGHSSGIGRAIASALEREGYTVVKLRSRLERLEDVRRELKEIVGRIDLDVVVNAAGVGIFEPHETISLERIKHTTDVNLIAPMAIARLTLPALMRTGGHLINISSIEATRHSRFSALYSATKAGLRSFSLSLFEEVRRHGVKISVINPDITDTPFFDRLKFSPKEGCHLIAEELAQMILHILSYDGVITEVTVRPLGSGVEMKKR
jgi:short-subunit dehydrogenase